MAEIVREGMRGGTLEAEAPTPYPPSALVNRPVAEAFAELLPPGGKLTVT